MDNQNITEEKLDVEKEEITKEAEEQEIQQEEPQQVSLKEYEELSQKYLRIAAEYDNYRKRTLKEKIELKDEITAQTVEKFLPVIDSFELAISYDPENKDINALYKQFLDSLERLNVSEIEAEGKEFDPAVHEAMFHEEDDSGRENYVAQVLIKGYKVGEKIIRHAKVKVIN